MWGKVVIVLGLAMPVLGQRRFSRRLQDAYDETVQGYRPPSYSPAPKYGAPKTPPYAPPPTPYNPPPHSCPSCPHLETYRIACRKADKLCCLAGSFTSDIDDLYPFQDQTCPNSDAVTAENICAALEADVNIVDPGTRLLPAGQIQTTGDWQSDRYAAIAAIGSADLCFNVYPHVKPGDVLDTTCENSEINDPVDVLSNLAQGASIATGGNLVLETPTAFAAPATFNGAVIVLGDATVLDSSDAGPIIIAMNTGFTGPDAFNGISALFAGDIVFADVAGTQQFNVVTGGSAETLVSSTTFSTLFVDGAQDINADAIAEFRSQFDAYLCSAFNQVLALADNGQAEYSGTGNINVNLNCNGGGSGTCVISTTADELRGVTTVTVTQNSYDSVIVRVSGAGTQNFQAPTCQAAAACDDLLFVLTQAEAINVSVMETGGTPQIFPLFAPVASAINFNYNVEGESLETSGIIAPTGSTITITNAQTLDVLNNVADTWTLPAQSVFDVIFCNCACDPNDLPIKKEEKKCVKSLYGHKPVRHY